MIFATPAQLANYLAGHPLDAQHEPALVPPANAGVLLRHASGLVADEIRSAVFAVGVDGRAVLPEINTALAEATCAQAAAWATNGVDPVAGRAGSKATIASKSAGGISVAYASYAADAQARSDLASGDVLIAAAVRVLDAAGLRTGSVLSTRPAYDIGTSWPYDPLTGRIIGPGDSLA